MPHFDRKLFTKKSSTISSRTFSKIGLSKSFSNLLYELKSGVYKDHIRIGKINKRFKKFKIFSLVQDGFDVLMRFKTVDFVTFCNHFNISSTNRVVGFMPDSVGIIPSKVVKSKNYITEFISENFIELKSDLSKDCFTQLVDSINSPRVVYSGGFDSCGAHLKEYFKDNTTEDIYTRDEILRIVSLSNFKWFAAPVCDFYNVSEIIENVVVNLKSFSGHYTSKIFGSKKGDSDLISRSVATKIWEGLNKKPYKNTYLWSVLGREKDIKIDYFIKKVKEVGTRVILTCESPITILLMWFSQKFNFILGYADWDRTYHVCGEFNNEKYVNLNKLKYDFDFELEADWSYYDSNIDTNFLEVGSAILCSGMPKDKLHNNIAYTFISSVVTKYVILPPGVVVELNRSQPSGHPAGTLVNCNVNLIYWCIIGYKIYGDDYVDNMRVEVYGDDTRAFFKCHKNLVNIDRYIMEAGLKSDPVLPNIRSTKITYDKDYQIDFLKRRFDESGMSWNHKKMFDKFLYQSKDRNFCDQVGVVLSFIESVPKDNNLKTFVKLFIKWVNFKYNSKLDRNSRRRIVAISSILTDDALSNERFDYQLGDRVDTRDYDMQLSLHSFSTVRRRLEYISDRILLNINSDKFAMIYALGIVPTILKDIGYSEVIGVCRPPPISNFFSSIEVNKCRKFYLDENLVYLNRIRHLANISPIN